MHSKQNGLTLINQMLVIGALGIVLALIVNHFWKKSNTGKQKSPTAQVQKPATSAADNK